MSVLAPVSLHGHDPETYVPHPLHAPDRAYRETNCYTDTLVELLHAHGLEPLAGLGHLVRTDFEGDQFTFFKMPPGDSEALYGVDVHEMQPVGALPDQIAGQLARGRSVTVELDAFFLPDVAATDYGRNHVKTTVAVEAIDLAGGRLAYFHNVGLHWCVGEDYRGVFEPGPLPPYLEVVRFDAGPALTGESLYAAARERLAFHLDRRPRVNPFAAFGDQLALDLPRLLEGDGDAFHLYAFATTRMAGAAFDLLRAHVTWLFGDRATPELDAIVDGCQVLSFRLARRRAFDPGPALAGLVAAWDGAMTGLERALG